MGKIINEIGKTYGYLTVIARAENTKDKRAQWLCRCKCGNEVIVTGKLLRNGHTQSCGCLAKEIITKRNMERGGGDLTGQRFGRLTVIGFDHWLEKDNGHRDRMWKCKCDCGNVCVINHRYLRFGNTQSCGCIKSHGNAAIANWLSEHNINYIAEYGFNDLLSPSRTQYKFDFAIFDDDNNLNFLIEYQGNIHFQSKPGGWNTDEQVADCQRRDKIKYDYCINKNIKLYYITYLESIQKRLEEIFNEST